MFCIHCGQKLDDDMKFCIYCGTRQEEVNDIEVEEITIPPVTVPPVKQEEAPKLPTCLLVLQDITSEDKIYTVKVQKPVVMGREFGSCTIVLENDKSVSRRHCEFSLQNGACYVKDLGSFNGTVLNGEKIAEARPVKVGDLLKVGGRKLMVLQCDMD